MEIELDQYERDNLLALLAAVGGVEGESALSRAGHTGDWNWQLIHKLGYKGPDSTDWGRPNRSAKEMVEEARRYVIREQPEWND